MNYLTKKDLKKRYTNLNPWIFAIATSTAIYGLLLLFFNSAAIEDTNHSKHVPQIIMLPLNINSSYPGQKQLFYWLQDENPTLIVNPNYKYGYSSILNSGFKLLLNKTSLDLTSILSPLYFFLNPFKIYSVPGNKLTPEQLFSRLDLIYSPNIPTVPFSIDSPPKLNYPIVKDYYSGKQLDIRFNNNIKELIKKYNPQEPTILLMDVPSNPELFPIVNIVSSCGSPDLDKEALRKLTVGNLSRDEFLRGKQIKAYVMWQ